MSTLSTSLFSRIGSVFLSYGAALYYHSCRASHGKLVKVRILVAYLCLIQGAVTTYYIWSLCRIAVAAFNGFPNSNQPETSDKSAVKFGMPPMANLVIQPMMKNFIFAMLIDVPIQFAMVWRLKSYTNFRVRIIPGAVLLINLRSIIYIGLGIVAARKAIQQDQPNLSPKPPDFKMEELSLRAFSVYTFCLVVAAVIGTITTVPLFLIFAGRISFKKIGVHNIPLFQRVVKWSAVIFGILTTIFVLLKLDLRGRHESEDPQKLYQSFTTFIPREFVLSKLYTLTLLNTLSAGLLRIECNASEYVQPQTPASEGQPGENEEYELQKLDGGGTV
ncbi:hypothetical protein ONZ45_g13109 [Pleurotus djamor]|nr:hypothetical protein ONZ45_g13109 [Pleurotus djamor]